jgi:hypothetical protein
MSKEEVAKSLVDMLENYVSGDGVERSKVAVRLMRRALEDKALEVIKRKFALQGRESIEGIIESLVKYGEDSVVKRVEGIKPNRSMKSDKKG